MRAICLTIVAAVFSAAPALGDQADLDLVCSGFEPVGTYPMVEVPFRHRVRVYLKEREFCLDKCDSREPIHEIRPEAYVLRDKVDRHHDAIVLLREKGGLRLVIFNGAQNRNAIGGCAGSERGRTWK